ncbi:MAG: hypothetical protein IPI67_04945 [Myxococcales bacterium]|nr:hypothetical protein [Myxococcales bacterium]
MKQRGRRHFEWLGLALPLTLGLLSLLWPRTAHAASADEEFNACVDKYLSAGGGSFTCTICGVEAGCTGDSCYWGSLKGSANDIGPVTSVGTQLYCLNRGGTAVTGAGPIAMQGRGFDGALRDMKSGATSLQVGGLLEYASLDKFSRYGAAVPFAKQFDLGSPRMDLSVGGNLLFSSSEVLQQFGFNARPTLRQFRGEPGQMRHVLAGAVPLQLVLNKGDGLDSALSYHAGLGAIAGLVDPSGKLGVGLTADVLYESGIQVPFQLVGRYSIGLSGGHDLGLQAGFSSDATATGGVLDDLQQNVMAGYDAGDFLYGAQVFRQGSDAWVFALGVSHMSRAAALAHGTDEAYRAGGTEPGGTKPAPGKAGEPQPITALLIVDAGDATASAVLRAVITRMLAKRRITPRSKVDADRAMNQSAPGVAVVDYGPRELGELRRALFVPLVIHVLLAPAPAGQLRADMRVDAAGMSARRSQVVPAAGANEAVATALSEILAQLGNDALGARAVELPAPPPKPEPPPPPKPEPPPATDPDAGAPSDADGGAPPGDPAGCTKDTDCKGDRVCESGSCVSPK